MVDANGDPVADGCCGEDDGQKVHVGPWGIHIKDGGTEVKLSWRGVRVRNKAVRVNLSVWRPLLGCAVVLAILTAIVTLVAVGIVKVMM